MPLIHKKPVGSTSRGTIEAYHYQHMRYCKKVILLDTLVPHAEMFSNPRYIDVEGRFNAPHRPVKVHDCYVVVGADMYLVTGYWYRHCGINRSIRTATGLTWRGELIIIKAGSYVPYLKRVSRPYKADIAAAKCMFILKYKLCSDVRKRLPTMIVS